MECILINKINNIIITNDNIEYMCELFNNVINNLDNSENLQDLLLSKIINYMRSNNIMIINNNYIEIDISYNNGNNYQGHCSIK